MEQTCPVDEEGYIMNFERLIKDKSKELDGPVCVVKIIKNF